MLSSSNKLVNLVFFHGIHGREQEVTVCNCNVTVIAVIIMYGICISF